VLGLVVGHFARALPAGLASVIGDERHVRVMAWDLDGSELERVAGWQPSVVVVDERVTEYPLLVRLLSREAPAAVLVMVERAPLLYRAMLADAGLAYVERRATAAAVLDALRVAARDREAGSAGLREARQDLEGQLSSLTAREIEVLHYVSQSLTYREIAARMHLSVATVKTHARRIRVALGVTDKRALRGLVIPNRLLQRQGG
jgi:DNA-binding NarL/FixJ family response regulator